MSPESFFRLTVYIVPIQISTTSILSPTSIVQIKSNDASNKNYQQPLNHPILRYSYSSPKLFFL